MAGSAMSANFLCNSTNRSRCLGRSEAVTSVDSREHSWQGVVRYPLGATMVATAHDLKSERLRITAPRMPARVRQSSCDWPTSAPQLSHCQTRLAVADPLLTVRLLGVQRPLRSAFRSSMSDRNTNCACESIRSYQMHDVIHAQFRAG